MFWPITGLKYWVERYSKSMGSELATCVMWNPRTLRLYLGLFCNFGFCTGRDYLCWYLELRTQWKVW